MPKKKKENRGGKRENAGRRLKYGEPTIPVNYRIPVSKKEEVDKWMAAKLKRWSKGSS